jgi:hypothetical protein
VFPGIGVYDAVAGIRPARISTSISLRGPGAYSPHDGSLIELFDNVKAEYYLSHANIKWISTNNGNASNVVEALKVVNSANNTMLVARFNFMKSNETFQQIGAFWVEQNLPFYWNEKTVVPVVSTTFDVLACKP